MTKEEKIKEAWGENWSKISKENQKKALKNNGFVSQYYEDLLSKETICRKLFDVRPKSLQGIETNNGWIKIESEDDLPKYIVDCWIIYKDKICLSLYQSKHFVLKSEFSLLPFNLISHYQPIEKPKPPIY